MINLDTLNSIKDRIKEARHRASREHEKPITIVAVTKTFPHTAIISAHQAGLTNIGENSDSNSVLKNRPIIAAGIVATVTIYI